MGSQPAPHIDISPQAVALMAVEEHVRLLDQKIRNTYELVRANNHYLAELDDRTRRIEEMVITSISPEWILDSYLTLHKTLDGIKKVASKIATHRNKMRKHVRRKKV